MAAKPWVWAAACVPTVLVALLLALLHDTRYFFYGDTQAAYYGWWYHLGAEVRAGHWPLLDPHAWRAGNLVVEGQWGLFSPLVIGLGLLATVAPGVLVTATAVKLALACVGALGVFALARSYDVPAPLAYLAGVAAPMGGMTQYLDLPSWVAGLMIWALFPWVWWACRRTMLQGANPAAALVLGYLLVTVGYVYGTIMLIFVLGACLLDARVARDRAMRNRVLAVGILLGLVALTVYLPAVLTAPVTVRDSGFGGFGGKFSTDPLALFAAVLPTASVHGTSMHLLPYSYLAWFLPVLLWLDVDKVRKGWRPLAGLVALAGLILVVVDGPARLGPLRWPLRLHPFLVEVVVVLAVVALTRFAVRRPSGRRLALSLLWVGLAGVVALLRAPEMWSGHLLSVALVGGGTAAGWLMLRGQRRIAVLAAGGAVLTLAAAALQHGYYPEPPSPQRNMPAALSAYQRPLAGARGDGMVVGDLDTELRDHPAAARDLLVGSAWYLNPHRVQNGYTTVSHHAFYERYCMSFQGATCPEALRTLFSTEPDTGQPRVDLLGVSTLLLVRADFSTRTLDNPPAGWRVVASSPWAVTWVRRQPVPGAGRPVWASDGTVVSTLSTDDRTARFEVKRVPPGGGRVVLSALGWPGYRADGGQVADPVDGYLLTVDVPGDAAGRVVTVRYSPPAWPVEVAAWWAAVVIGAGWCVVVWRRRRAQVSAASSSPATHPDRGTAAAAACGDEPPTRSEPAEVQAGTTRRGPAAPR